MITNLTAKKINFCLYILIQFFRRKLGFTINFSAQDGDKLIYGAWPHRWSLYEIKESCYEHSLLIFLNSKNFDVFFDFGANLGIFPVTLKTTCNKMILVEADPVNLVYLNQNITKNKIQNCTLFPLPVSPSGVDYVSWESNEFNSALSRVSSSISGTRFKSVHIKDVISAHAFSPDDNILVKVDIEGMEEPIIQEILETLKSESFSSCLFVFEHNPLMNPNTIKIIEEFKQFHIKATLVYDIESDTINGLETFNDKRFQNIIIEFSRRNN